MLCDAKNITVFKSFFAEMLIFYLSFPLRRKRMPILQLWREPKISAARKALFRVVFCHNILKNGADMI